MLKQVGVFISACCRHSPLVIFAFAIYRNNMKILLLAVFVVASSAEESALQQIYSNGNREFSAKVYQVCFFLYYLLQLLQTKNYTAQA